MHPLATPGGLQAYGAIAGATGDRNLKFHEYDLAEPTPHLDELIEEVKLDRTGIFWG